MYYMYALFFPHVSTFSVLQARQKVSLCGFFVAELPRKVRQLFFCCEAQVRVLRAVFGMEKRRGLSVAESATESV